MTTSFRPENDVARRLFSGRGFTFHEVEDDGEIVYRLGFPGAETEAGAERPRAERR